MPNFEERSNQLELLDYPNLSRNELWLNMAELDTINRWLGGHKVTLSGLEKIISKEPTRTWFITDLGCGGGDTLRSIALWAKKKGYKVNLTGVDLDPYIIEYARNNTNTDLPITYYCEDFKTFINSKKQPCDIRIAALFAHHLYGENLSDLIKALKGSSHGFVLNDLHRHYLAWLGIKILTQSFSKSRLVKNDAPLSVERGFLKKDLKKALDDAQIKTYSISWIWAFRWQVIGF